MFNAWGYGVYFFFASLMVLSTFFVFFLVPETKSIPLEVMDRLFETKPVWRANKAIMAELTNSEFRQNADGANLTEKGEGTEVDQLERKDNSS